MSGGRGSDGAKAQAGERTGDGAQDSTGKAAATKKGVLRSLRVRIGLLAMVTCVCFATAVGSFVGFVRSSHRATVSKALQHLTVVASDLATTYAAQAAMGASLREVPHGAAGPPPPPSPRREGEALPPPPSRPGAEADPLSRITAAVLAKEEGIEGGFMAARGPLVGYAFPTHEGPGERKEMPQREMPTIAELARRAEDTGAAQSYAFEGSHDVTIFAAMPLRDGTAGGAQETTGAVWLMERLPDINRGRNKELLYASLGFGAAALLTALLAWFVTVEVSGGVLAVTERLSALEADLTLTRGATGRPQLLEFERVLAGINAMAISLHEKIGKERSLEDQLRHKERLSSLGQFAAGVAHELRNPLATIRLRAQMSQHAGMDAAVTRNSGVILEEVDRLDAMIGRLLFARPISLELQTIDAAELCAAAVASWAGRAPETIRLRCEADEGVALLGDRSRLLQVLDNLIENAIQAMQGRAGEVRLRTTEEERTVRLEVMDEGSGFAPGAMKHAFDPFYTTKETGTGLGLSIAFELVEAHGGELKATPRAGGGAMVSVVLPRAPQRKERVG